MVYCGARPGELDELFRQYKEQGAEESHAFNKAVQTLVPRLAGRPNFRPPTEQAMVEYARTVRFFEGVEAFLQNLTPLAQRVDDRLRVDPYLISSTYGPIARNIEIRPLLKDVFACEYFFDGPGGQIGLMKRSMDTGSKPDAIRAVVRGIVEEWRKDHSVIHDLKRHDQYQYPDVARIMTDDGLSGRGAWRYVRERGGISLSVCPPNKQPEEHKAATAPYTHYQLPVDYRPGGSVETHFLGVIEEIRDRLQAQGWLENRYSRAADPQKRGNLVVLPDISQVRPRLPALPNANGRPSILEN